MSADISHLRPARDQLNSLRPVHLSLAAALFLFGTGCLILTAGSALSLSELPASSGGVSGLLLLAGLAMVQAVLGGLACHYGIVKHLEGLYLDIKAVQDDPELILHPYEGWQPTELKAIRTGLSSLFQTIRTTLRQQQRLADIGTAVAKINHDLRNSLAAATLLSDQLEDSTDPQIKQAAPLIVRSTRLATDMCQQMLDYLTALPEPQHQAVAMSELMDDAGGGYPVTLAYHGPQTIRIDRQFMTRILGNLTRNAYLAGASQMSVDIWNAGHLLVVDISDNGPGIPADKRDELFSAFASTSRSGSGLGLSICLDLALAMGGKFYLSRSSEAGSEFRMQLPVGDIRALD